MEILVLLVIAGSAFIATNLDDLFLLMAFFSSPNFKNRDVVLGQYLGISTLIVISSLAYFFQIIIPSSWLGLLGVFPILIGLKHFMERKNGSKQFSLREKPADNSSFKIKGLKLIQVALTTLANGGDNIGIYAPLFAVLGWHQILFVAMIFMIFTGVWCLIGFQMINNKIFGDKISLYLHFIFPFVLMALGVVIIVRGIWEYSD